MADWMAALRDVAPYLDLGWRLAVSTAAPPLLGHFLIDDWWGTTPWGVLVGAVLGITVAGMQLRRLQVDFGR
jgi:F0F1-type ATP synthase assembly protein I